MKGFFKWFKSGAKMKRWMLVILIGIILACFGIAKIIVTKELSFFEVGQIVILFIFGFTMIIVGLVYSQKRVLELLIEETDDRLENGNKNVNVKSLIFNKKVYEKGPNIVVIGGGSGLNTVLKGMKEYTDNITAIVTVSSYGKVPTNSRKQLDLLPVEDIKESMISLSTNENEMKNLLNLTFENDRLRGLCFGDVYLLAMKELFGDFSESIERASKVLNITGKVLPVTLDEVKICAELDDGTIIEEKDKIPEVVYDKVGRINRVYINPSNCRPSPGVLEAIKEADAIIIGPGSLYTNVIPNLLVKNVAKEIKESKAIKIYVSNIMTEPGQTDNYSLSDHINAIIEHAGKEVMDCCIYDTGEIIPEFIKKYNMGGQDLVEQDIAKAKSKGVKLLPKNISCIVNDNIRHDAEAVAEAVIQLICDDLKYKNELNNPQYVRLNTKLKDRKKQNKKKDKISSKNKKGIKKINKKIAKHEAGKKSKFQVKYAERIESIQKSETKRKQNITELTEDRKRLKELKNRRKTNKREKIRGNSKNKRNK